MNRTRPREPLSPIDKQFYFQVKYGRKITFSTSVEDVTGYLAGWDRYAWFVLEITDSGEVDHRLIYKGAGSPLLRLHKISTLDDEPPAIQDELKSILTPFRSRLLDEYGGSTSPRNSSGN